MDNKAQVGIIGGVLLFVVFLIIWFIALGGWITAMGQQIIETNHYGGLEAFFYANLNLVIFIGVCVAMMAWVTLGGGAQ